MTIPWSELPFFLALARQGSLSAASKTLKLDRTTVSRRIDTLEKKIAEPLFERFDGSFVLTSLGRRIFAASERAEQELKILSGADDAESHGSGKVRVSLSEHLLLTLSDCFKDFVTHHPDILLELTATDRAVDLKHYEADVVLRISRNVTANLDVRKIGKPIFALYQPAEQSKQDLGYIARPQEKSVPRYVRSYFPDAKISLSVDGIVSMKEMIANGAGAGILPVYFGDRDPRVTRCSEALPAIGFMLCILCLPEQKNLQRIKTFINFAENYFSKMTEFFEIGDPHEKG